MKVSVNLASRPYVELGPVYNRLRTWMAILAVLGVALWFLYRNERGQAEDTLARVQAVEHHVQQLQRTRQSYQTLMQQPKDAAILDQSDFLNDLFRRKAFSWTATMTDLETVLPSGVEVTAIDPVVAKDGRVTIRLRVTGGRDRSLDLIRNLEQSKHFAQPRVVAETLATGNGAPGQLQNINTNGDVNFDILADYRPLPLPVNASSRKETAAGAEKPEKAEKPASGKHGLGIKRPRVPAGVARPGRTTQP